ncbi:MAG TPA: iron-only hydrogenase system regulator [Candidatus Scybalocola faecavium]|nr:iron-only hydrogenase system regulator [Candidatus Scybalocola faecavium]
METQPSRIAVIGIIVEDPQSVEKLNAILHNYSKYILGRMGIPYREKNMSIISIVMDAPANEISALSGKLGMLPNVSTKTLYSKITSTVPEDHDL